MLERQKQTERGKERKTRTKARFAYSVQERTFECGYYHLVLMEVIRPGTSTFLENSIVKTKPAKPKHDPGLKEKATTVQKKMTSVPSKL